MADNIDREGEQTMFDMIRGPDDDQNEEVYDGSEFLNNTGEGDMIFDRDDRIDEVMNYDYDDEENVDLEITETDEVYLYKQTSSDHHMFFYLKIY